MLELERTGSVFLAVVAAAVLWTAAAGIGVLLIRPPLARHWATIDAALVRLVVGFNLVGLLGVVLGLLGLLAEGRSLWLLLGLSLPILPHAWRLGQVPRLRPGSVSNWIPRTGLLAVAAITLGPALCYPSGWDELVYHSTLPKRWLEAGWPAFFSDIPYSGFPSLGEILFWLVAPIEYVITPRLIVWMCWILGLACLYRLLRRTLTRGPAAVLTLAFSLNSTMLLISANCYVETIVMMNAAAMLLALGLPVDRRDKTGQWMLAAAIGVVAGGAAAVKMTGFATFAVPCLWYLGKAMSDRSRRGVAAAHLAASLAVAVAVSFPFYLRPWMATGNPFYPYFCWWFTGDPARIDMSHHHHAIGGMYFGVRSLAAFVDGPLLLAFSEKLYDGEFGWQTLAIVLLAIVALVSATRPRVRRVVLWPATIAFVLYVFWFFTAQQARFVVPAALAFMVLAGKGLRLVRGNRRRAVLCVLLVSTVASIPWKRSGYYWHSWRAALGQVSRIDYVHNVTEFVYLPLIEAIYETTPPDARLALVYEHRGFYIPRRYVIATPLFQEGPFSPPEAFRDASRVVKWLHDERISHLVMAKNRIGPDQKADFIDRQQPFLDGIEECLRRGYLAAVWESEEYLIFAVSPSGAEGTGPVATVSIRP